MTYHFNKPHYAGKAIVINENLYMPPKMTLALNVPVTDEFRAATNKWMLEFFGKQTENMVIETPDAFHMCSEDWNRLKATVDKRMIQMSREAELACMGIYRDALF